MNRVTQGDIKVDLKPGLQKKKQRISDGASQMALGVAQVVTINEEDHKITLRVVTGADQEFQRNPIVMSYPGAGKRHFLGAMPNSGDYALIGHMAQESDGRTMTPVVLGWIIPGTWVGQDWLTTQPFAPDEWSFDPKDSSFTDGVFFRERHKLRHMQPGNIVASSSQGADLVLNEDVQIMNRRCNEFILRDQDQAAVTRAQQRFDALAGTRLYSGMVQREATFLPSQLFDDGVSWDGPLQFNVGENRPYTESELRADGTDRPFGDFTPNSVFDRRVDLETVGDRQSGVFFDPGVDPYEFLKRGLFLSEDGNSAYDNKLISDAVYGGKSLYRVSAATSENGVPRNAFLGVGEEAKAYTEHRIEVSHVSDGRLPVTDQTDDFDAERLPRTRLNGVDPYGQSSNKPFIEVVYGTVVGNDPFTLRGRSQYGLPLKPVVFDDSGAPTGTLEVATGSPVEDQAAMLFSMTPPGLNGGAPTWWGVNKGGRLLASIGGKKQDPYSAEIALKSGLRLSIGGDFRLEPQNGIRIASANGDSKSNLGVDLASNHGAVRIYGGGNSTLGSVGTRSAPTGQGEADAPSVIVEGKNNVSVKSSRRISIESSNIEGKGNNISSQALSGIDMQAGDRIGLSSKTYDQVTNGKAVYSYHGPKDGLPTNGAFRETTFTGIGIGTIDKYTAVQGDREEVFFAGSHSTTILVGDITYETQLGTFTAKALDNSVEVDALLGITNSASVGNINVTATSGSVSISGQVGLVARSSAASVISGAASVTLGAPGKVGNIVCSTDLDPLTGLPLATYGMGSPGHLLGPPV